MRASTARGTLHRGTQSDNIRLIFKGACRIGMNNDRAGSLLCSFQTFQTFMLPGLGALCYPRHGTFARWCAARPADVVQERAYLVTYIHAR